MKVWVVVEEVMHEGGTVSGVFSTEELAKAFVVPFEKAQGKYRWFEIGDFILDVGVEPWWVKHSI